MSKDNWAFDRVCDVVLGAAVVYFAVWMLVPLVRSWF